MTDQSGSPKTTKGKWRPGRRFWMLSPVAAIVALIVGWIVLSITSTITVRSLFFDSLGMGDAYSTRWQTTAWLALAGLGVGLLSALPILLLRGRMPRRVEVPVEEPARRRDRLYEDYYARDARALLESYQRQASASRLGVFIAYGVVSMVMAVVFSLGFASMRDTLLAARSAVPFGTTDSVFGRDLSFFVFQLPAMSSIVNWLTLALILSAVVTAIVGFIVLGLAEDRSDRDAFNALGARLTSYLFAYAGLFGLLMAASLWLSRYGMVYGGDEVVAGAGKAALGIDLPIRTIGAFALSFVSLVVLALAHPALRRRAATMKLITFLYLVAALWAVMTVFMIFMASAWCVILLIPTLILASVAWSLGADKKKTVRLTPMWAFPVLVGVTILASTTFGPIGAGLNDGIVLRGTKLQVEAPQIQRTLDSTRAASGLDQAVEVKADYRQNGVTREAIAKTPASIDSLRFLDHPPTKEACARLQTFNQFYTCDDIDLDRYEIDGRKRSVFVAGREIDYEKVQDFQRRHFTFTHGYGLISAPVNEIDPAGRPKWNAGGIPQSGLELTNPEIYFGAQADMPWALVGTKQPQFDGLETRQVEWKGTTGIRVGSGWQRLALTKQLGGLPYIGGGRRFWNATKGDPAGPDSKVLIHRDIDSRVSELAPFLRRDADPYFVAADKRLFVVLNTYVSSNRYPYAASYDGSRYLRQAAIAVMDAYSGETHLYVVDASEPMTATWAKVYPSLFTPISKMPAALREHLRVGEDLINYQSRVAERFHVTNLDNFYNNDEGWAPTQEAYGPGVNGTPIVSPVRYTYAVLPGEESERFVGVKTFKPRTSGRGIGFSGWLAVDNSPESFGKLTLMKFAVNSQEPLDSLDTFTANLSRNDALSAQLGVRRDQVLRGNTIVVPIGEGLLYTQPLYLDSPGDSSLPTLWQVVVSFGDGRIFAAATFAEALEAALIARPGGTATPGAPTTPGAPVTPGLPSGASIQDLVRRASAEYEAYRKAFGAGDDAAAARHLAAFQQALAEADAIVAGQEGTRP